MTDKIVLRDRKNPQLWQSWKYWDELMQLRKRHLLRISAIERGASNYDVQFEHDVMEHMGMNALLKDAVKMMVNYGTAIPVWPWITGIRGLKQGSLAAQLLSQIDDIARFDTVSKLWRFAGYAVINGERDRLKAGEKAPYSTRLKSTCYLVSESFIKQQTPGYVGIYYAEKERQQEQHPAKMCKQCGIPWDDCTQKKKHYAEFTPNHLHLRAMRKMTKIFLQHLWVEWRTAEDLPVTLPYAHAIMGHSRYLNSELVTELVV